MKDYVKATISSLTLPATCFFALVGACHLEPASEEDLESELPGAASARYIRPEDPGAVRPVLNCVEPTRNGKLRAHWGYSSTLPNLVKRPVGNGNRFTPGDRDRGQPSTFAPGIHEDVFDVAFGATKSLTWTLGGTSITADSRSPHCCLRVDASSPSDKSCSDPSDASVPTDAMLEDAADSGAHDGAASDAGDLPDVGSAQDGSSPQDGGHADGGTSPDAGSACESSPDHILVTEGLDIVEFTLDGREVRRLTVPPDGTPGDVGDQLRDIAGNLCGSIFAYQGTFVAHVASRSHGGDWSYMAIPGFSTVNNQTYGGLAFAGQYVFATDMFTYGGGDGEGVIRFSMADGTGERFGLWETEDLNIGLDGLLYTLSGETIVQRYDPDTMAALGTVYLSRAVRAIAVSAEGVIYGASWDRSLYEFDAQGALLKELYVGLDTFADIDVAENGTLVASTTGGTVVASSRSLSAWSSFIPSDRPYANLYTFVAFVR